METETNKGNKASTHRPNGFKYRKYSTTMYTKELQNTNIDTWQWSITIIMIIYFALYNANEQNVSNVTCKRKSEL
jgi:hypothetical protein